MSPQEPLSIPAVRRKWQMDIGSIAALLLGVFAMSLLSLYLYWPWGVIIGVIAFGTFFKSVTSPGNGGIKALPHVAFFDQGVRRHFPRIWQMVEELARAAAMPKPEIMLLVRPGSSAVAWASPRPMVGLQLDLAAFPPSLVSAMLAHEIAHLKNKDEKVSDWVFASLESLIVSRRWFVIGSGVRFLIGILFQHRLPSPVSVVLFFLFIWAVSVGMNLFFTVWFPKLLQQHEYAADALGSVITGDPVSLIMVLAMLEEPPVRDRSEPGEDGDEQWVPDAHPPTKDRISALMRLALEMKVVR